MKLFLKWLSFLSFILSSFLLNYNDLNASEWVTSNIDVPNYTTGVHSGRISTDTSGYPHIVYFDEYLNYAYMDSNGWYHDTVDSAVIGETSHLILSEFKIDSFRNAHITYYDSLDMVSKYATNSNGDWTIESLGQFGFLSVSMAIDSSNKVHICYFDSDAWFKYATNASGSWTVINPSMPSPPAHSGSTILLPSPPPSPGSPVLPGPGGQGGGSSIVLDASNNVHICYIYYSSSDQGFVSYATNKSGAWIVEEVESIGFWNHGRLPTVKVDPSGYSHISYTVTHWTRFLPGWCAGDCHWTDYKYATNTSGSWVIETIGTNGHYNPSDDTLPNGTDHFFGITPHISGNAYYSYLYSDGNLKLDDISSGSLVSTRLSDSGNIRFEGVDFKAADNVHIFYLDKSDEFVKYVTNFMVVDIDTDGVPDEDEHGPDGNDTNFDGNNDGNPDCRQDTVASFHTYDGDKFVTLATPDSVKLINVSAAENPSLHDSPLTSFPYGFFDFTIKNVMPGGATTVTIYTDDMAPTVYYKYGPTADDATPHWYEFMFDGQTGAQILGNVITLHFVDGLRGDDDLQADGDIEDIGAPGTTSGGSGGCFISTAAYD